MCYTILSQICVSKLHSALNATSSMKPLLISPNWLSCLISRDTQCCFAFSSGASHIQLDFPVIFVHAMSIQLAISFKALVAFSFWWWFPFLCRSFLVWCSSTCLFLLFLHLLWLSNPKNHGQGQCQGASCLCSLLGVSWFQVLHWSLSSIGVNFCAWCKMVVQLHSCVCGCPVLPTVFTEETVLSPSLPLGLPRRC